MCRLSLPRMANAMIDLRKIFGRSGRLSGIQKQFLAPTFSSVVSSNRESHFRIGIFISAPSALRKCNKGMGKLSPPMCPTQTRSSLIGTKQFSSHRNLTFRLWEGSTDSLHTHILSLLEVQTLSISSIRSASAAAADIRTGSRALRVFRPYVPRSIKSPYRGEIEYDAFARQNFWETALCACPVANVRRVWKLDDPITRAT
ncbi:hypothetical protein BKA66DRAFT_12521 [Pyrenochaeta sp. MPI-SDFR-AT-0127]|nr:hypothetical protein BKA66DRAFT_12521 [Pyrenochaeta sp. MPI-SDFR-AT-0127]